MVVNFGQGLQGLKTLPVWQYKGIYRHTRQLGQKRVKIQGCNGFIRDDQRFFAAYDLFEQLGLPRIFTDINRIAAIGERNLYVFQEFSSEAYVRVIASDCIR